MTMPDESPKKRSLSEISHLFLSSVRDRQTDGASRPKRTPPTDASIDLTPEEFARVYGGEDASQAAEGQHKPVPISAVIAAHLNGKQFDRTKEYARALAERLGRVGLIELDASELRLMCFEPAEQSGPSESEPQPFECVEPRQMIEALQEMNWDIEHWLVLIPNPRTPEARSILREIDHWVLLSTCDHDGIVSSYRMLKGMAETHRPLLTLSLLDATDDGQVTRVFQKLAGVCQQFLDWPLDFEPAVVPSPAASEHLVLMYRPTHDKAQLAAAPQWAVVAEFIASAKIAESAAVQAQAADSQVDDVPPSAQVTSSEKSQLIADVIVNEQASLPPEPPVAPPIVLPTQTAAPAPALMPIAGNNAIDDVIDLPGQDVSGGAILAAVLGKMAGELIECPLRPPMCLEARLAVGRDRSIALLAVASQGLRELQFIGQAFRWLKENRELIAMALPQFAIDPHTPPRLRLLVDRADLAADVLQPMLQSEHVTVQAYRKLRWGQKLGVFFEAA
jgi:hypothetical protein